jgi:Zn-dependent protease with chaperone function
MATSVGAWWAVWDLNGLASPKTLLFWIPPLIGLGAFLSLAYSTDTTALNLKWTVVDVLRLTCWRLMSFVVPLLLIINGFDDALQGNLWGCAWIGSAGVVAIIGTALLRSAEGMKMHEVKSSETRNRALPMARRLGIDLRRVYVVPAGRGHLTNAFGFGASIGLTDNLGKYLDKSQIDFIIAHELAHVEKKHGRTRLLLMIAIFSATAALLLSFRRELVSFRPVLDVLLTLAPLATFYFFSRRHEYEADRRAAELTHDPESAVRAMRRLPRATGEPMQCSRAAEMFLTHPAPIRRVEAISRAAIKLGTTPDRVGE